MLKFANLKQAWIYLGSAENCKLGSATAVSHIHISIGQRKNTFMKRKSWEGSSKQRVHVFIGWARAKKEEHSSSYWALLPLQHRKAPPFGLQTLLRKRSRTLQGLPCRHTPRLPPSSKQQAKSEKWENAKTKENSQTRQNSLAIKQSQEPSVPSQDHIVYASEPLTIYRSEVSILSFSVPLICRSGSQNTEHITSLL